MICTNPRTNQIGSDSKLSHCWLNVRIYGTTKHWWSRATPTGWCKLKVVSFDKYVVVFVESYQRHCVYIYKKKKTKTLRSNPCQATNLCTEAENLKKKYNAHVSECTYVVCVCAWQISLLSKSAALFALVVYIKQIDLARTTREMLPSL